MQKYLYNISAYYGNEGAGRIDQTFDFACSQIIRPPEWYQSTINWLKVISDMALLVQISTLKHIPRRHS